MTIISTLLLPHVSVYSVEYCEVGGWVPFRAPLDYLGTVVFTT